MVKLFENMFRSVNIALVNEVAQLCHRMGLNVWEVIEAAATKPYGFMKFLPGPGVGGHCIPLDHYYLSSKAREYDFHVRFIELAGSVNEAMPYWVVDRVAEALNHRGKCLKDAYIVVLGVAYKRDIADTRESPVLRLMDLLAQKHAKVAFHDPFVSQVSVGPHTYHSVDLESALDQADCVVIGTDHSTIDYDLVVKRSPLVFDSRGVLANGPRDRVVSL